MTPAVERKLIAHLKAPFGLSERRVWQIAGADRGMGRCKAQRAPDTVLRDQCANWPMIADASNTTGSSCCCAVRKAFRHQPDLSALPRGAANGAKAEGPTRSGRNAGPDLGQGATQRTLVAGFRFADLRLVHDHFAIGQRCLVLDVFDEVTLECLAAIPDTEFQGAAWRVN